jgi:hypothetical protein
MRSRKAGPRRKRHDKLRAVYAKSRREFSAADLQKFTVIEKGIPLEKVIAQMQRIQRNSQSTKA